MQFTQTYAVPCWPRPSSTMLAEENASVAWAQLSAFKMKMMSCSDTVIIVHNRPAYLQVSKDIRVGMADSGYQLGKGNKKLVGRKSIPIGLYELETGRLWIQCEHS